MSMAATGLIGVLVFAIAVTPPSLIWIINMFAFGGLETAFFWVLLLGLFWRKANKAGALLAMAGGTFIYILPMLGKILLLITSADWAASLAAALAWSPFGLHRIVLGLAVSLICFIIGAYKGKPTKDETLALFFPGR
jgi:sodium/pantothenate symporter